MNVKYLHESLGKCKGKVFNLILSLKYLPKRQLPRSLNFRHPFKSPSLSGVYEGRLKFRLGTAWLQWKCYQLHS